MSMNELLQKTLHHLNEGNFTALQHMLGGPDGFDRQIIEWHKNGNFSKEPEMLAKALSCACMLGRTETAAYLLDNGVDPYSGMKTWLSGPHYAVSSGHLNTVKILIEKGVPIEVKNLHGGTLLGQALWSIINEYKTAHAEIIELLLNAGSEIEPGTIEWWHEQKLSSETEKQRIASALQMAKDS